MCNKTKKLSALFIICVYFVSLCETKIEIIHKSSKSIVYTVYEKAVTLSSSSYNFSANVKADETYIVADDSTNTCGNLKQPPRIEKFFGQKNIGESNREINITFILLSTIKCNVEEMAENARKLGYSALILYGNLDVKEIEKHIQIPAFFISEDDGNQLREAYTYPKRYYVRITENLLWEEFVLEKMTICFAILMQWIFQSLAIGSILLVRFLVRFLLHLFHLRCLFVLTDVLALAILLPFLTPPIPFFNPVR